MSRRPLTLSIAALGGQGGGVLAGWLIETAEAEGHLVQSTSVPGVAQRTGATIYYLEFFPRDLAASAADEPVMALMPVPGDVDCVVAAELAEAGRVIQRGLVTPDRTTLIASSHRSYAIGEKSALGSGAADQAQLFELVREHAKRLIMFDMEALADRHDSVISSVLLGAICGGGVLPFKQASFEAVIEKSGIAVSANLAAFRDACRLAAAGTLEAPVRIPKSASLPTVPSIARSPSLQPLLDRILKLPPAARPLVLEGTRRLIDFQDPAYGGLYLDRLERVAAVAGTRAVAGAGDSVLEATARSLALWMSFEDTIRVADLKSRAARFERVRAEVRAAPGQLVGITEFFKPGVAELAGTLPLWLGRRLLESPRLCRTVTRFASGKRIRTSTVSGFLLLRGLASLKRWRRGTLRYREENGRIERWLGDIERLAAAHPALTVEVAHAQSLVKGYGETHERGWRSFSTIMAQLDLLAARHDGAEVLTRLRQAALADEEGARLASELAALAQPP